MHQFFKGKKKIFIIIFVLFIILGVSYVKEETKGKAPGTIYVLASADASKENGSKKYPYTTIQEAVDHATKGTRIIIGKGEYAPFYIPEKCSGTAKGMTTIKALKGTRPIIKVPTGSASKETIGIEIENASNICISELTISGGTQGIYYESNSKAKSKKLNRIIISNCQVKNVKGVHGIAIWATNDKVPVTGLVIENCKVHHCLCGDSESVVVNGNIDGFVIRGNTIHDNNNIGIDMAGFWGVARHKKSYKGNLYDVDYVRNGKCYNNKVYNISSNGNSAYLQDGEYALCAGGIYVDGGQNIEIYNNEVFGCDIGIEVATEQKEKENALFQVTGIKVHDNIIRECKGFAGLTFGGYDASRGYTIGCHFYRNTLMNNPVQIAVQRSKNNRIYENTIIGGETMVEYSEEIPKSEMKNYFFKNKVK